jgi:nuclear pore complex protein Nup93
MATGGGLFGNRPAPLFSGFGASTASTSAPQQANNTTGSGLFGGSTTGAVGGNTGGTSLFGNLNNQNQNQQQTQNQSGGLFGQTSQAQNTTQAGNSGTTTSGFGGFEASTQVPQQTNTAAQSQGPLQQSMQNGQSHAYFDSLLERSRKRVYGESGMGEDLPALQLGLGDLRQRIKRLNGAGDGNVDGRAHYLLAASGVDPGAAVRDLNAFSSGTGRAERSVQQQQVDTDVEGYLANIQTQTTLSMIADGLARSVRDFDAFLEDNVTMEWEAQRKKIYQHFGIKPREDMPTTGRASFRESAALDGTSGGFGRSRKSKAAALAGSRGPGGMGTSSFGRSSMAKSAIGAASSGGKPSQQAFADVEKQTEKNGISATKPGEQFQRDKQMKYAERVQDLNVSRLRKRFYPVCKNLSAVIAQAGEQHGPDMVKAYQALSDIVSENPDIDSLSDPLAVKERSFAKAYLDENSVSSAKMEVNRKILRGGTRCLERLAFDEVESLISKNPREANLGGIPNVISKVKAYVRLLASKKRLSGDNVDLQILGEDYVWALVYYLLRTGHIQEIVDYVSANAVAFRAIDRNFSSYISEYCNSPDRRLRRDLQDRINNEYNQRLRIAPENSIDPYRMACYKIIGRCDLKSRNLEGVNHTVEDFVWLQLVLARESNRIDELASEAYGLVDLQKTMKEIGNRFFEKGGAEMGVSFGSFVFFQVACGMFEQAVSYLYPFSYTDAVHLAIALDFYGLLRVSDPSTAGEDLLSYTTRENPQINFGRMLGYYTRDFRTANAVAAVDYLVLICLNKDIPGQGGISHITLCHDALRELVLESRDFASLLGDLRYNGERQRGVIEERIKLIGLEETSDFMRTITIQAASIADDNGRVTDAVLLYFLAGEVDTTLRILNRVCGEFLAVPIGQEQLRLEPTKSNSQADQLTVQAGSISLTAIDDPMILAGGLMNIFQSRCAHLLLDKTVRTYNALYAIQVVRNLIERGQYVEALDVSPPFTSFHRQLLTYHLRTSQFSTSSPSKPVETPPKSAPKPINSPPYLHVSQPASLTSLCGRFRAPTRQERITWQASSVEMRVRGSRLWMR